MINRRSFLQWTALVGASVATSLAIVNYEDIEKLSTTDGAGLYRVSQSRLALGTHVDITAIGPSKAFLQDALERAFADIQALENDFSRYDNHSPVCELNTETQLAHIPAPLAEIIQISQYYQKDTNGAFDITVKPLIDLFQACAAQHRDPTDDEIAAASAFVGPSHLTFYDEKLAMTPGSGITLDGIAPGFIADKVAHSLLVRHIDHFLVNAGGEIRTHGQPHKGAAWKIAIQDPNHGHTYPGFVALHEGAVSTSGSYEIFFGPERRFHHIVNARTGHCPQDIVSVTVTAPTAVQADILSTALFVMTPPQAMAYVARHPDIACLLIDAKGKILTSDNFQWMS